MICSNCHLDSIIKTNVGKPDELWECSNCGWWHKPFVGLTGTKTEGQYRIQTEVNKFVIIIVLSIFAVMIGLLTYVATHPPQFIHRFFSVDGKCYDEVLQVGTSRWQTVHEVPCVNKPIPPQTETREEYLQRIRQFRKTSCLCPDCSDWWPEGSNPDDISQSPNCGKRPNKEANNGK